jgi:excisionase family DNA binding protein
MSEFISVEDLAAMMGRSRRWVYHRVENREIPFIRLTGKTVRFRKESIESWLLELEQQPKKRD